MILDNNSFNARTYYTYLALNRQRSRVMMNNINEE